MTVGRAFLVGGGKLFGSVKGWEKGPATDGKTVWSWHPLLVSSRRRRCSAQPGAARRQFAGDGDKTNSSPGRARHKPLKPLRRERRLIRSTCGDYRVHFFRTRAAGATGTRRSLRPPIFRARDDGHPPGRNSPRECGGVFGAMRERGFWSDVVAALSAVMPRFMRGIQYAAASRLKHWRLWNTGSPDQVGR